MVSEFKEFDAALSAFAKKMDESVEEVVQRLALMVWQGVVSRTPVDTGRARASWRVGVGEINRSTEPDGEDKYSFPSKPTFGQAEYAIYYITNSLPYISALENGHSAQRPGGMVKVTLADVENYVRKAVAGSK